MNRSRAVGFAIAGFLVGLAALPGTRWVVPTQLEVLTGGWRLEWPSKVYMVNPQGDGVPTPLVIPLHVEPKAVLREFGTPRSAEERLVALLMSDPNWGDDPERYWVRFEDIYTACEKLDTAPAWAQFARLASMPAMLPLRGDPIGQRKERLQVRMRLVEACVTGERLEPDNAFFPLVRCVALRGLGQAVEAARALDRASRLPHYRSYDWVEPEMVEGALEARHPRSQLLRSWLTAWVLLPHLTAIKSAVRASLADGSPAARVAACRIGALMMREGRSLLDPFVGHQIVSDALRPPYPMERQAPPIEPKEAQVAASALASQTAAPDLADIVRDYARLAPAMRAGRYTPTQETLDALYSPYPLIGACALASLVALPLVLWGSRLRAKFGEASRWAAVPVVWLFAAALSLGVLPSDLRGIYGFASFALLAPLSASARTRKTACVLGAVGCALVLLLQQGSWAGWLLVAIVLLGMASGRFATVSLPISVAATVLACALVGGTAAFAGTLSGPNALGAGLAAAIALMFSVPGVRPGERAAATAWTAALLGCAYAAAVLVGIRADAQAGAVNDALRNEASRLRIEMGVRPN